MPALPDRIAARPAATAAAVIVLGTVPLLVAVIALAGYTWHPVGDLAQATLRMHSFWAHPPLVGPAGRIGTFQQQGNHPGPAMFWLTWPAWRLLGGSAWANQASVALLAAAAYAAAVVTGWRVGGWRTGLVVATVGAVLMRSFGAVALTQPWNPYVPLVPFLLFALLCWGALCGRLRLLPLAVLAGSFCIQCHVGYAPAVVAGIGVAVAGLALDAWRARYRQDAAPATAPVVTLPPGTPEAASPTATPGSDAPTLGRLARWVLVSLVVGAVAWIPPVVDQVVHDPGNLRILLDTYRAQTGHVIGFTTGLRILLTQLNPVGNWLRGTRTILGSPVPGALLLVAWAAGVVVAVRARRSALVRLDVVIGVLTVCALYWATRLDSTRYLYLVEWFWVLTGLMVVTVGWSASIVLGRRRPTLPVRAVVPALLGVSLLVSTVVFTWTAAGIRPPDLRYSETVGALVDPTAAKLDEDRPYLVRWVDPDALGGNGFGLLLALEERGFDVGAAPPFSAAVEPHRVREPGEYDAVLTVVSGDDNIAAARALPQATELAYTDHRSPAQRRRYGVLRDRAARQLRAAGLDDLAARIGDSIWVALIDPRVPQGAFDTLSEMLRLGQGTAVFRSEEPLPDL